MSPFLLGLLLAFVLHAGCNSDEDTVPASAKPAVLATSIAPSARPPSSPASPSYAAAAALAAQDPALEPLSDASSSAVARMVAAQDAQDAGARASTTLRRIERRSATSSRASGTPQPANLRLFPESSERSKAPVQLWKQMCPPVIPLMTKLIGAALEMATHETWAAVPMMLMSKVGEIAVEHHKKELCNGASE